MFFPLIFLVFSAANACRGQSCPANEEWTSCAPVCPPQICASLYTFFSCVPDIPCTPGCQCIDGYLRDGIDGPCIPSEQCPPPPVICDGPNEFFNSCWSPCETTCAFRFRDDRVCLAVCSDGCSCEEGYLRNDDGICVPIIDCSPPVCNRDETYSQCGTACEENCDNFDDSIFCPRICVEGCFCSGDTVRESEDSLTCVATSQCPAK